MLLPYLAIFVSVAMAVVIPGPPGPHSVALKVQTFEDSNRWDPFAPEDKPEKRRVLVSGYIPIKDNCSTELVPYLPPDTVDALVKLSTVIGATVPAEIFQNMEMEFCKVGDQSCGSESSTEKYPLVLFSPGLAASRLAYSFIARALASYGYIVVTMDHTYDSSIVEFPDGSKVEGKFFNGSLEETLPLIGVRKEDTVFMVNQLTDSSVASQFLAGTKAAIDSNRIFMFGHSLGGATAAAALHDDNRILGGLNFDGQMQQPATIEGVDQLLVLIGKPGTPEEIPGWQEIWGNLRGPGLMATVDGTAHMSYFDLLMLPTMQTLPPEYEPVIKKLLGTIDAARLEEIIIGSVRAALDSAFDGKSNGLCNIEGLGSEVHKVNIRGLSCS